MMPAAEMLKRGALVVLEGVDRSGKSTQCRMLKETLSKNGHAVELFRFPDMPQGIFRSCFVDRSTAVGKVIGDYLSKKCELDDHAVHLLFSANRWEMVAEMKKQLQAGVTLIVDRYAYSGVAFTAAKPGFSLEWCKQPDVGLPKPDLVLFLTLTPEEAAKRGGFGKERYEQTDFQRKVAENYKVLGNEDNWKIVDANRSVENLHIALTEAVTAVINTDKSSDIKQLWMPSAGTVSSPSKKMPRKDQPELLV